ncbi:MAG: replication initiation factor domain-containing protein [Gaiellales bacterium]|nr:MAG: replication initiation factor domain-containing protein [Gaiellales bacterium]
MESTDTTEHPFTLVIDWLAFTLPDASDEAVREFLGGDWIEGETGFRGYPKSWISAGGSRGVGKLGTGAPRRLREAHVDLSGGIVSAWDFSKLQGVLRWIREHNGKVTRIDCALDDRKGLVSLAQVEAALEAGQVVTHADDIEGLNKKSIRNKCRQKGATLYIGSPKSQTRLRIYDKRLELQQRHRPDWENFGIRWELQLKEERANACAQTLACLEEPDWHEFVVGLLRSYVDFRDIADDDPDWVRYQAPLLPWWAELTEGFRKSRLIVQKETRSLEDAKQWVSRSLAPMLAVLAVAPGAGEEWLRNVIAAGADRWKLRHYQLLKSSKPLKPYKLKPS